MGTRCLMVAIGGLLVFAVWVVYAFEVNAREVSDNQGSVTGVSGAEDYIYVCKEKKHAVQLYNLYLYHDTVLSSLSPRIKSISEKSCRMYLGHPRTADILKEDTYYSSYGSKHTIILAKMDGLSKTGNSISGFTVNIH